MRCIWRSYTADGANFGSGRPCIVLNSMPLSQTIRARLSQANRIEELLRDQAARLRDQEVLLRDQSRQISQLKAPKAIPSEVVDAFHKLYYGSEERTWRSTRWLGVKAQKCPLDLWIYQELLTTTRPDVVIETGTADGGSALYVASVFDLLGTGQIVTIDIAERNGRPEHPRIRYVTGSSTDPVVYEPVLSSIPDDARVMVILDSDHTSEHVLSELLTYAPHVTPGCYLVVEDTNVNGHPVLPEFGPGPLEAVRTFLNTNLEFDIDTACERLWMTFNPGGYLRRREPTPRLRSA